MHVIITLAGHSRRFASAGYSLPKFLITIDGKTMLEHVVDMFDPHDNFHFVLNSLQLTAYPDLSSFLAGIARNCSLVVIEPHEYGPVHSALQVRDIPADAPVIVSYCDFFVLWDYTRFKAEAESCDAAVPAFTGFHPASFGNTLYAYMRVDDAGRLLELREKQCFTERRCEEPASAGIYYFRSWTVFRYYSHRLMHDGFQPLKEGYVSLLVNLMLQDGLLVKVTAVQRFICWGTPEDLEQYLYWSKYFLERKQRPIAPIQAVPGQVNLIPMAGKGSRFRRERYNTSKPLILIGSRPMILEACASFPPAESWVFLPRAEDLRRHSLAKILEINFAGRLHIVPVDHDTSGQAATCLLAKNYYHEEAPLLIASCDYKTVYDTERWREITADQTVDAAVWTYRLGACLIKDPKAFGYCVTYSDSTTIRHIVEKEIISDSPGKDPLIVGTFWFRRGGDFRRAAEASIAGNLTINGEHYVADCMNLLLDEGRKIIIFDIEQWISFGDPFELDIYYYWEEFFHLRYGKLL
jgi:NDP-sugar pyrophosphorylase family protein